MIAGFVCVKSSAPIDGETQGDGRWCSGRPSHLHRQWDDGSYQDGQPSWERVAVGAVPSANGHRAPEGPTVAPSRFVLRSAAEIEAMPPPAWLIDGYHPAGSFMLLFGQAGSLKTFEALETAACVAAEIGWHGRSAVKGGHVVYVAAEGARGLGKRLRAWRQAHEGADLSRLWIVSEPVNLMSRAEVETFIAVLGGLPEPPQLIVIDTLARCMVGADENSGRDMGVAVASVDLIKTALAAAVLVIHHMGRQGDHERGHTALRGAADVVLKMVADGNTAVLTCEKMKDDEEFGPVALRLRPVEGADSCVLEAIDSRTDDEELSPKAVDLLKLLDSHFGGEPVATSTWLKVSGLTDRTFYRGVRQLSRGGYIGKVSRRYALTTIGRETLGINPVETTATAAVALPITANGSEEAISGVTDITAMAVPPTPLKGGTCHGSSSRPTADLSGTGDDGDDDEESLPW